MKTCINLRETFGSEYKVVLEESHHAETTKNRIRRGEMPWNMRIICRRGHIFPWGGNRLGVFIERGLRCNWVKKIPGVEQWTDGDDGITCIFDASLLDQVATIMHPQRRRKISQEQKQQLRERMLAWHRSHPKKSQ